MNKHVVVGADVQSESPKIAFSVVQSSTPRTLTKRFDLMDGVLEKHGGGILVEGAVEIVEVEDLEEFGKVLQALEPNQALVYGLPETAPAKLTTLDLWQKLGCPESILPRTADKFSWNNGSGILMMDYDPEPGGQVLDREHLVSKLWDAVPGLKDAAMLWFPSASSHIVNTFTGEDLTGLRGQRLYIAVSDARDIPRAGKAIVEALWLAGLRIL